MKYIKRTIEETLKEVEKFENRLKISFNDIKKEIIEHYSDVPFVKEFKTHRTFERIQLFEFYQESGMILRDHNNLDDNENKVNLGKVYKDPTFMINNIIEENKKVTALLDNDILKYCMYDGEGLSLILTQNGFEWENVGL